MKKQIHIFFMTATMLLACAPQTETRVQMDTTGKRLSDSIAKLIDSCLALPGQALIGTSSPIASSASSFTPVSVPK